MYEYEWDAKTRGYKLTKQAGKFVASEIRPVYAQELNILGFNNHFSYDENSADPIMWAKNNVYIYSGREVAKLHNTQQNKPLEIEYLTRIKNLKPVDVAGMIQANKQALDLIVIYTLKRIKEIYDEYSRSSDVTYIAFSGGKDSVVLLDLCDKALPISVPVIFSDTTMELPSTYQMWETIQKLYPHHTFMKVSSKTTALENWKRFGPPSRTLDWCCSIHKATPVILELKENFNVNAVKTLAFLGIRSDESIARNSYDGDVGLGVKNASQTNAMPILSWGAHELFLYTFANSLPLNSAYLYGVPRVGCIYCPKSSEKYAWFVDKAFPDAIQPYQDIILDTTLKHFESKEDAQQYLASTGWQARRNGLEIKNRIPIPGEVVKGSDLYFNGVNAPVSNFIQWCKTIGAIEELNGNSFLLSCKNPKQESCSYAMQFDVDNGKIVNLHAKLNYVKPIQKSILQNQLKRIINKLIACVGCRACEAECRFGALNFPNDIVSVDSSKCIHCLKCHDVDRGCWRYKSLMVPNSNDTPLKSIANYQNFGLREVWVEMYSTMREEFLQTAERGALGGPMLDSARLWFRQALLAQDSKTLTPTRLLDYAVKKGANDVTLWDMIWIGLANNAPLIKWFAASLKFNVRYTSEEIGDMLSEITSASSKKGGMQALLNMFKSSPLGDGGKALVKLEKKGQRIVALTRIPRSVDKIAVLYSLYVMGAAAKRTSFTISEMMNADFDSAYISPLTAFGMTPDELKGVCLGLSSVYPKFIACSFTLGLDEVKIFPQDKTLDDVVDLALK